MKKTILFAPIIAIAIVSTLFSCVDSDKDFYDSSFQMPNPMGDGFAAPEGFGWDMITTRTVTVEVKDEFEGQHNYLIEIYDENPLSKENALMLAKGVAQKGNNFTIPINLSKEKKGIYIKQTDPRGRVEVFLFDVPVNSSSITCKLYYSNPQNRSLASRASATKALPVEKPDYNSIPADAIELTPQTGNLQANTSYKITSEYNKTFTFWGNNNNERTKVYVAATWKIPEDFTFQNGIEIIVMPNGKIETSKKLTFVNTSMMTIMDNANVTIDKITFTNGEPAGLRNWGTLSVTKQMVLASGASLYNKGTITCEEIEINSNSQIVNDNKIDIDNELKLPSDFTLENNGELNAKGMIVSSNAKITNNSKMKFESISWTNPEVENNCSIEATSSFYANGCTLNLAKGYIKASTMTFVNGVTTLSNGSMLEATVKMDLSGTEFIGTGEASSMIKSSVVTGKGFIYNGNLAIESNDHIEKNQWWDNFKILGGAFLAKMGESKVIIDICTGIKNEGNPGGDPGINIPSFPIELEDNHEYTYLFEDQWPLYGDYDLNDIVMTIRQKKIKIDNQNKVVEFSLSIDLDAAGAMKGLGAAIMLDNVLANAITDPIEFADNNLQKTFNLNNRNIENGQDNAVIPLFDNAHLALGRQKPEAINTISGYPGNTKAKNISFTIKFNNPTLSSEAFNINKLNIFIIVGENRDKRNEIHVVGFQPTNLANTAPFGGNNDNSSLSNKRYYISKDNLAWGITVPANFKWPLEYVNIKNAYPQFVNWVTSGGVENKNWWNDFDVSNVFQTNKN